MNLFTDIFIEKYVYKPTLIERFKYRIKAIYTFKFAGEDMPVAVYLITAYMIFIASMVYSQIFYGVIWWTGESFW